MASATAGAIRITWVGIAAEVLLAGMKILVGSISRVFTCSRNDCPISIAVGGRLSSIEETCRTTHAPSP